MLTVAYPPLPTFGAAEVPLPMLLFALVLLFGCGFVLGHTRTRTQAEPGAVARDHPQVHWVEPALTVVAAGIATAVAVNGMWRVFGDTLGLTGLGRFALAGFLEVALLVSALRARRNLREHGSVGVDGAAVWVMASLSAVLASADAVGLARMVRFAAPLVAAWLWERGLAAERRRTRPREAGILWRWTPRRVAVLVGLAEPAARDLQEVQRSRRLVALTRTRLRLAALETSRLPSLAALVTMLPVRRAWVEQRLHRQAMAAVENLNLGSDPQLVEELRATVAAVAGLKDATAPPPAAPTGATRSPRGVPLGAAWLTSAETEPALPVPALVPGTPGGTGSLAHRQHRVAHPVGSSAPAPVGVRRDEDIVADILDGKVLPSIRALRRTYRLGQQRAVRIRAAASEALVVPTPRVG